MIPIFDTCHNNENYDENPGIRKRYWMNQEIQLKQHLKTTTRAFKCIDQIRKCISFWFSKICWHFSWKSENAKFDENPEIRKIYWMNQGMQLKQELQTRTRAFKCIDQIRKCISFWFSKICWHFFMKIWKCWKNKKIWWKSGNPENILNESRYAL